MSKYCNPYIRLQTYYNWLSNDSMVCIDQEYDLGVPILRLHEVTEIPLEVIRQDILCLFRWQISLEHYYENNLKNFDNEPTRRIYLEFDEYHDAYTQANEIHDLDALFEQVFNGTFPDRLRALLLCGALDSIPLYISNPLNTHFHIPLTPEEAEALHTYSAKESEMSTQYESFHNKYENKFHIKDSYRYNHQYVDLNTKLSIINEAIQEQRCLQMTYITSKNERKSFYFKPLKISYDATENLYSIISIYEGRVQIHRLDQVLSIEDSKEQLATPDMSPISIAPNVWGNCFSDPPEYVKIRFYNEANVWKKVRKDLAYRSSGKLYEKDGFLYYEDIVYGTSKLRPWLYGYGSSAVVVESRFLQEPPDNAKTLREYVIESLEIREKEG